MASVEAMGDGTQMESSEFGENIKRTLCKYFLEGNCDKGAGCGFAHGDHEIGQTFIPTPQNDSSLTVKRSMCKFYDEGKCQRGTECEFAHTQEEIGQVVTRYGGKKQPPPRASRIMSRLITLPPPGFPTGEVKRTICKFWSEDKFAHGNRELGKPVQPPAVVSRFDVRRVIRFRRRVVPTFWAGEVKRTICKFWAEGKCNRGAACGFAHGDREMGTAVSPEIRGNPEVKRTICKFWEEGTCDKGHQCGYAHGPQEIGKPLVSPFRPVPQPRPAVVPLMMGGPSLSLIPQANGNMKRKMCRFFEQGRCDRAATCTFAHGPEDVGSMPPMPPMPSMPPMPTITAPVAEVKRTICKFWQEGNCNKQPQACGFAHGEHELGQPCGSSMPSFSTPIHHPPPFLHAPVPPTVDTKRTICKFWREGTCEKVERCGFAHGDQEIGQLYDPNVSSAPVERKRTLCKFYHENERGCERGANCGFAHGEEEIGQAVKRQRV